MAVRRRVLASSHHTTHRRVECVWNRCVQTWDLSSKSRWMHFVEAILKICAVGCKQHGLTPLHIIFEAMIIICDHLRSSMIQYIRVCQTKLMPCRWNYCVGCCRNKASEQVSMVWRSTRWTAFKAVRRRRGIDQYTLSQVIKISHVESLFKTNPCTFNQSRELTGYSHGAWSRCLMCLSQPDSTWDHLIFTSLSTCASYNSCHCRIAKPISAGYHDFHSEIEHRECHGLRSRLAPNQRRYHPCKVAAPMLLDQLKRIETHWNEWKLWPNMCRGLCRGLCRLLFRSKPSCCESK